MDLTKLIAELRAERARIEEAIVVLERLGGTRRGRKPAWMSRVSGDETVEEEEGAEAPKKRRFSPEARKRMAEAQRKRWAAARGDNS